MGSLMPDDLTVLWVPFVISEAKKSLTKLPANENGRKHNNIPKKLIQL